MLDICYNYLISINNMLRIGHSLYVSPRLYMNELHIALFNVIVYQKSRDYFSVSLRLQLSVIKDRVYNLPSILDLAHKVERKTYIKHTLFIYS
jgi:hypothetical protein